MATYAAYRHVELDHVGYGKKRVLKPPGGGSSDIFGLGGGDPQQSPRKVKQYMASNISLTDGGVAAPSGTGPGSTSSAASTASSGETPSPGSPSGSPARNGTAQAQAPAQAQPQQAAEGDVGPVAAAGKAPDGEPRGRQFQMQSHFSLGYDKGASPVKEGGGQASEAAAQDGNPVTGEGYKSASGPASGAAAARNRVPPGGYSSGLW